MFSSTVVNSAANSVSRIRRAGVRSGAQAQPWLQIWPTKHASLTMFTRTVSLLLLSLLLLLRLLIIRACHYMSNERNVVEHMRRQQIASCRSGSSGKSSRSSSRDIARDGPHHVCALSHLLYIRHPCMLHTPLCTITC